MKALPQDPFAFQARVMGAFCEDLFDLAAGRSKTLARTDALHAINSRRDAGTAQEAPATDK